ncbi:MAG: hypothetical protein AAFP90_11245 [Planctomycetota bacterium]
MQFDSIRRSNLDKSLLLVCIGWIDRLRDVGEQRSRLAKHCVKARRGNQNQDLRIMIGLVAETNQAAQNHLAVSQCGTYVAVSGQNAATTTAFEAL